jgi:phytoene dehydrogenase-like protein
MKALAEGIGLKFIEQGGDLRTGTLVDRDQTSGAGGFEVVTRRGRRLKACQVAFNLPIDRATHLLGRPVDRELTAKERKSRAAWSAVKAYLAIDRRAVPDDSPLFHQLLRSYDGPIHDGNNVLVSLSPLEDTG